MTHEPRGLVEVGGRLRPVLVVGFEPHAPLAHVLAGEQFGQPGSPDVGAISSLRHDDAPSFCVVGENMALYFAGFWSVPIFANSGARPSS